MDAPPPQREPSPAPKQAPEVPAYPAPLPDPVPASTALDKAHTTEEQEEAEIEAETKAEETDASLDAHVDSASNCMAEVTLERLSVTLPPSHLDAPLESPIAQPEELRLPNGLPLPDPQDPEAPVTSTAERDDSPIAEPDVNEEPVTQTSTQVTQAVPTPVVEATPAPGDHPAPPPADHEIATKPVVQAASAEPEGQDIVPPDALDVKDDAPVPTSTAKEDMPSPAVCIDESTTEVLATPPPPTAEEREDTPPPSSQTVVPAPVETTMQGWSLVAVYSLHMDIVFWQNSDIWIS